MFLEVFCASTLATLIFGNNSTERDYSYEFSRIHDRLDNIDDNLRKINNDTKFIRARECLKEFSPKLLGEPTISRKCCTVEDIQKAACQGFGLLLNIACADKNNFIEARKRFNESFGNIEWVKEKYGEKCENFKKLKYRVELSIGYLREVGQRYRNGLQFFYDSLKTEIPSENAWFYERKKKKFIEKWEPALTRFFNRYKLSEKYFSKKFIKDYYNYTGRTFNMATYFGRFHSYVNPDNMHDAMRFLQGLCFCGPINRPLELN